MRNKNVINNRSKLIDSGKIHSFLLTWSPVFQAMILGLIAFLAFSIRIFSVIRFESIIHEFDPWFNYRSTRYLVNEGVYKFWNWFDSESWYPIGRSIGGTVYPGIMLTSGLIYHILKLIMIPIDIRNICVFIAPAFAGLSCFATYFFTLEITRHREAGLISALFIAIVPSCISRTVAGSYDNEAVAIFALVITLNFWIKAVNRGSILYSLICALSYFYMVAAWGGYSFIINIIPIYTFSTILLGKYNYNVYIAYSIFYIIGTLLSFEIPFVGFRAISSSEHYCSHGIFIIVQFYNLLQFGRKYIQSELFVRIEKFVIYALLFIFGLIFTLLFILGYTQFGGRSMSLFDYTYAGKHIPIIASVSEHQTTTFTSYFFDLHYLLFLIPVGMYYCTKKTNLGKIFIGLYGVLSIYFSCVMVRLVIVLAPCACILGGIGYSYLMKKSVYSLKYAFFSQEDKAKETKKSFIPSIISMILLLALLSATNYFVFHSSFSASEAYSSPSVILSYGKGPSKVIIDDYREAYYWLRMNTNEDSKIMSWWDYGYQIAGFSNRTTYVDNNTWNYTHIATVGRIMSSPEEEAFKLSKLLGVDYILVIYGGMIGYSSDDISKFLWMVRIGGGVYSDINEADYYHNGNYRTDSQVSETMKNCIVYKFCYYRIWDVPTKNNKYAFDNARGMEIGYKNYHLDYFTEAFTSEHWIVRIFKLNKGKKQGIKKSLTSITKSNNQSENIREKFFQSDFYSKIED